jgi:methionyl-tRNA synthetase
MIFMEPKPTITYDEFAKIDLRVATVIAAELHPNADKLLKLQLDVGGEQRQVCAGIREHYAPGDLVGKQVVVVANLQPRTLRGEVSSGMLLAASQPTEGGGREVVLLQPAKPVQSGSSVA